LAIGQSPSPSFYTLHKFEGAGGGSPTAIIGGNGVILGATSSGGIGLGTIFSITIPATVGGPYPESAIYTFTGENDGAFPTGLISNSEGVLFGTDGVGQLANGTVFSLTPPSSPGGTWVETPIYNFTGGLDGGSPDTGVTLGPNGVLYGTTFSGGANGNGVVFSLTPPASPGGAWTEEVLFNFAANVGDTSPSGGLAIGPDGVLYGTAFEWADNVGGAVYSLTPPKTAGGAWTPEVIHLFGSDNGDGDNPVSGVVIGPGGVLYGATEDGGTIGSGTVFSLTPPTTKGGAWTETVLHSFTGITGLAGDGANPESKLVIGPGGVLYGTTAFGGAASSDGTIFSLTPPSSPGGAWTETILHDFSGTDGRIPGSMILGENGVLYGTTLFGGLDFGTLFAVKL
jgi:uncharacterized repeat protein (TIGR03803 family)